MSLNTFVVGLTTKGEKILELKGIIKDKKEDNKGLQKTLEGDNDRLHNIQRTNRLEERNLREDIIDIKHRCVREVASVKEEVSIEVTNAEYSAKLTVEKSKVEADAKVKKAEAEIKIVKDDSENKVRRMKEECGSRMGILKTETEAKIKDVKLTANKEAEEEMEELIDDLQDDLSEANENYARANSRAEERLDTIKSLKEQITNYKEFVKYAINKLPDVKLDKFNINVDVPATTVVNKTEVVKSK